MMEPENPLLDQYIIAQSPKARSSVCFLLFQPDTEDIESFLMEQDVIYVGGGNTKSMIALWREWQLDEILRHAYENGTVLAGLSAGANCWFEQCSTDSIPGAYRVLPCLGILQGSFCPHYDGETDRRPSLYKFLSEGTIANGYAADDGAAAHFVDDAFAHAISSRPNAKVYRVGKIDGQIVEAPITTRYLGE